MRALGSKKKKCRATRTENTRLEYSSDGKIGSKDWDTDWTELVLFEVKDWPQSLLSDRQRHGDQHVNCYIYMAIYSACVIERWRPSVRTWQALSISCIIDDDGTKCQCIITSLSGCLNHEPYVIYIALQLLCANDPFLWLMIIATNLFIGSIIMRVTFSLIMRCWSIIWFN